MAETIAQQITYLAAADGTVSEDEKKQIARFQEQAAKVKALTLESTESVMGIPASYWLDLRGYSRLPSPPSCNSLC